MFAEFACIFEDLVGGGFDCGEATIRFFKVFIDRTWNLEVDWISAGLRGIYYRDPYALTCRLWT
jgi:hypothetical protein